jgi:hypothetical protein
MGQPVVLVTFSCESGEIEKQALAAAVGAVQGRALIRLRRLSDAGIVSDNEDLARMRKEYVPPTEKDILGADGVILVAAPGSESSVQWTAYLEMVDRLTQGVEPRKVIMGIGLGPRFIFHIGASTVTDPSDKARALGLFVANEARARKQQQEQS